MLNSRSREAAQRFAERRRREDEAPRLSTQVPELATLRLQVEERRGTSMIAESKHIRPILVDRAPALFVVPCTDSACTDGGHDVTREMLQYLRAGTKEFVVKDECNGSVGTATCERVLWVFATATYGPRRV